MPTAYQLKKYGKRREKKRSFPLTELRRREALSKLLKRTFSLAGAPEPYLDYLHRRPFMEPILIKAAKLLRARCGSAVRILLDLVPNQDRTLLVLSVETDAAPTEAVNLLDKIDDDWKSTVLDELDCLRFDIQNVR